MGWKTDQIVPPSDVVCSVVDRAIRPTAARACSEFAMAYLVVRLSVWVADEARMDSLVAVTEGRKKEILPNAEVRIHFRRTYRSDRCLFYAQLRIDDPADAKGYAGFVMRGEVKTEAADLVVNVISLTNLYNRSDWLTPV